MKLSWVMCKNMGENKLRMEEKQMSKEGGPCSTDQATIRPACRNQREDLVRAYEAWE
jgi:hypothetical protein